MENQNKIKNWEERNDKLVSKIELFYQKYEKKHRDKFLKDEFRAHKEMLVVSGLFFKEEIDAQVSELWDLNQSFLTETFN